MPAVSPTSMEFTTQWATTSGNSTESNGTTSEVPATHCAPPPWWCDPMTSNPPPPLTFHCCSGPSVIFCDDVILRWSDPTPMLSLTGNTLETHLISLVLSEDLLYPLFSRRPGSGPLSESGPNLANLGEFRLPSLSTLQVSGCWWGWSNHLKQSAGWACLSRNQGGLVFGRVQPPPKPLHEPSGCSWLQFNPQSHLWWSSDQEEELHMSETPLRYTLVQTFIWFKSEPEKLRVFIWDGKEEFEVLIFCVSREQINLLKKEHYGTHVFLQVVKTVTKRSGGLFRCPQWRDNVSLPDWHVCLVIKRHSIFILVVITSQSFRRIFV